MMPLLAWWIAKWQSYLMQLCQYHAKALHLQLNDNYTSFSLLALQGQCCRRIRLYRGSQSILFFIINNPYTISTSPPIVCFALYTSQQQKLIVFCFSLCYGWGVICLSLALSLTPFCPLPGTLLNVVLVSDSLAFNCWHIVWHFGCSCQWSHS